MNKLLPFLILLTGCSQMPMTPDIVPHRTNFVLRVVEVPEEVDIDKVCSSTLGLHAAKGHRISACNSFNQADNVQTIYVHPPRHIHDVERFHSIGHEVWHGVVGNYHKNGQ